MSPEQCAGDRDVDGRSDLYSLGTVAYQMLTGEPPFVGGNTPSMMLKHVAEAPVPVRQRRADVPEDLERIVMRLLAKNPADRFADGAALVAAFDGAPVTPVPPVPPETPRSALAEMMANVERLRDPSLHARLALEVRGRGRRELRDAVRAAKRARKQSAVERVQHFRRSLSSWIGTSAMLAGINAMSNGGFHGYWWCLWAIVPMGMSVIGHGGRAWSDGIPLRALFGGRIPPELAAESPPTPASAELGPAAAPVTTPIASAANANDAFAPVLRQAIADRETVHQLIAHMSDTEQKMLPDVQPTADALLTRIVALNAALRRLEPQIGTGSLPSLDARIAAVDDQGGDSAERDRRAGLLRRQREKLAELVQAHGRLLEQYESAGLVLRNLALDLLKARSSGLEASLGVITSATQEARALSREIGYVLSAADELRGMESKR